MEHERRRYDRRRGREQPPGEPGRQGTGGEQPPGTAPQQPPGRQPGATGQGGSAGPPQSGEPPRQPPAGQQGTTDRYGAPGPAGQSGSGGGGGQPRTGPPAGRSQGFQPSQAQQSPQSGQPSRSRQPPQGYQQDYGTGGAASQAPPGGQSRQPGGWRGSGGGQAQQAQQGYQSRFGGAQGRRWEQPPVRPVTVEDVFQSDVVTVQPDTPVRTVVASMSEHDVGTTVVVDGERAVGIVTDRMVAMALETQPDISSLDARDLMVEDLVTVTTGTNVDEVLTVLAEEGIRRVPVVDDGGRLQGIVSLDDLVVLVSSQLNRIGQVVEAQAPRF